VTGDTGKTTAADLELSEIAEFARRLAVQAGRLVMPFFRDVESELKPDGTQVTIADRKCEELIRRELEARFPRASILGEELGGEKAPVAGDQWIVDPIDGTAPFVLGLPLFGVLIALLRDGRPVVGVVHMPALGETLFASTGAGCRYRVEAGGDVLVRCEPTAGLEDAYVSASGLHGSELDVGDPRYRLAPLAAASGRFRVVGDCVQHVLVCRGRLHLALDPVMAPWDSAALVTCVREAGGVCASLEGAEDCVFAGSLVSAASRPLLDSALALVRPER